MKSYPELYILRHGQTIWNAENRLQGELNSPLTEKGKQDAKRQGDILKQQPLQEFIFISSPQARAIQTAGIALGEIAQTISTDARLREIGVGEWSGLCRDDLPKPDVKDPFIAQYELAPGGEGFQAVKDRCASFLHGLTKPAVLVTHGITSYIMRELILGPSAHERSHPNGGQGCVYHIKDGTQKLLE